MILGQWLGIEQENVNKNKTGILDTLTNIFTKLNPDNKSTVGATEETIKNTGANAANIVSFKAKKEAIIDATKAEVEHAGATNGATAATVGETAANTGLAASFKALWTSMKPVLAAIATNPLTWIVALGAAAVAIEDYLTIDYGEAHEALEESKSKYDETKSSLESLRAESETTKEKIEELNSLKESGDITLAGEVELENLELQNAELERKIKLEEKLLAIRSTAAINDAKEAMTKGDHSVAQSVKMGDSSGKSNFKGTVGSVTDTEAVKEDIDAIQEYEENISNLEKKLIEAEINIENAKNKKEENIAKIEKKAIEDELKFYEDSVETLYSDLDTRSAYIQGNLDILKLDPENNAEAIKELEDALDSIANMDLLPKEKDLKAIESFFDGSVSKNAIKKQLQDAYDSGKDLEDELGKIGLTLDDIGVDNIENLNSYFKKTKESTEEAKKSVRDYAASIEDLEVAGETENKDSDWTIASEKYKEAKELLKEGKTGTDDFQSMARFLNPELVKKYAEEDGKYAADAYEKAFREVKETANRWFGEDETKSVERFVNDFKDKGLFDVETDDMGLWDITTKFKTTAEAANEFGMSVESVETMLNALEAYGYDFSNIKFSTDGIEEYESALGGIKDICESLEDGDAKDRLEELVKGFEKDLTNYKDNLDSLPQKKVIEIQLEYDLATIQQEIDKLQGYADEGGDSQTWAQLNATKKSYRDKSEDRKGNNIESVSEYKATSETIDELRNKLVGATEEQKIQIQQQISNLYDLQNEINNAFADSGLSWEEFVKTDEYKEAIDNMVSYIDNVPESKNTKFSQTGADKVKKDAEDAEDAVNKVPESRTTKFDQTGAGRVMKDATDVAAKVGNVSLDNEIKFSTSGVESTLNALSRIWNKIVNIEDNDKVTVTTRATSGGNYQGTAHLGGSAYVNGVRNDIPIDAFSNDRYKTKDGETALTGELGQELIVHGNRWWTVGDKGAEFAHIPAGSVVFNHEQTKQLLRNGSIKSRGKAHLNGTAYRLGNYNDTGKPKTSSKTKKKKSIKISDKKVTNDSMTKELDKLFDWIEIKLERLATKSANAESDIERANTLDSKLTKTSKAIDKIYLERDYNELAASKYKNLAKKVAKKTGLKKSIIKKIQNGSINISEYGEKTQTAIKEYQEWYDKYLSSTEKVTELEDKMKELTKNRFDIIQESMKIEQDIHDSMIERNQSKLDLREAKGYSNVSKNAEDILRSNLQESKKKKNDVVAERNKYQAEFNRQVKNGKLKKGTNDYKEAQAELNRLNAAVNEASIEVINHADALRQIKYEKLNNAIEKFERAAERIQHKIDLKEARDQKVTEANYKQQINKNNQIIEEKYELRKQKLKEQKQYSVGSEKYKEIAKEIQGYDDEIYNLLIANETAKDNIFATRFAPLEEGISALQNVRAELDSFRGLFNEEAFFDSKTGALTGEGAAQVYLIEEAMIAAKQEIANYSEGLEKLEKNYKNGVISQEEFNEKSEEYRQGIQNATSDVKDYSDTLVDLYLTQMNKENEILQKTIDLRKEALQRKAEYYDYDKNIRNQTKDINALKAQAAALEGSNDADSQAELKRLKQQIADAEEELSETKRSHSIDMQQQGYDALSQDLNDVLEDTETEIKSNADKQLEVIDSMLQQTVSKYAEAYKSINKIISSTGFEGSSDFDESVKGIKTQEGSKTEKKKAQTDQGKVFAEKDVKDINTSNKGLEQPKSQKDIERALQESEKTTNRKVAKIELSKSKLSLKEGESKKVTATVLPADAKNRNLKWESSNKNVATVSGGTIKAKKAGTCTITATAKDGSGKKDSVTVTVTKKETSGSTSKDGKITKGEKVTFSSGKYTAKSDGSGKTGSDKLGKSVYISSIKSGAKRPYQISSDKAGKKVLGWVSKSQLKGYASGSKYIPEDQFAWTQERGSELITLPDGSVLTKLPKGSGVIPHNLTENLWNLARSSDDLMSGAIDDATKYINNIVNSGGNNITYHYDCLLNVEGNVDKDALPGLQEILKQAYQYTSQQMTKDALRAGNKLRR